MPKDGVNTYTEVYSFDVNTPRKTILTKLINVALCCNIWTRKQMFLVIWCFCFMSLCAPEWNESYFDARLDFLLVVVRCSHLLPVLLWSLVSHLYNLRFFWSFQSSDVFKWYRFHCWKPKHSIFSRTESSLELSSSTTGGHSCSESNTVTSHPQLNINMWTVWSLPTGVLGKVQVFRFNPEEAKKRI